MQLKKLSLTLSVGLGLALAGPAQSAIIQQWNFEDDNIEFLLTPVVSGPFDFDFGGAHYNLKTSGTLDVGDVLVAVIEFPMVAPAALLPSGKELTGLYAVEVDSKQILFSGPPSFVRIVFKPFSQGIDAIIAAANGVTVGPGNGGNAGGGAMTAGYLNDNTVSGIANSTTDPDLNLLLDVTHPQSNCTNLLACVHQATLGSLIQVDGFKGDKDETWTYIGQDNVSTIKGGGDTTGYGLFDNIAMSNFFNSVQPVCFQKPNGLTVDCSQSINTAFADSWVQVRGGGNMQGGVSLSNGAFAHSDYDIRKYVSTTPEPASLALFGIGLLGLGFGLRPRPGGIYWPKICASSLVHSQVSN